MISGKGVLFLYKNRLNEANSHYVNQAMRIYGVTLRNWLSIYLLTMQRH